MALFVFFNSLGGGTLALERAPMPHLVISFFNLLGPWTVHGQLSMDGPWTINHGRSMENRRKSLKIVENRWKLMENHWKPSKNHWKSIENHWKLIENMLSVRKCSREFWSPTGGFAIMWLPIILQKKRKLLILNSFSN